MAVATNAPTMPNSSACFAPPGTTAPRPVWMVGQGQDLDALQGLSPAHRTWLWAQDFNGQAKRCVLLPGPDGTPEAAVLGVGDGAGEPCGPAETLIGLLPALLPAGTWALAGQVADPELAAVAWGLGAYRFRAYKSGNGAAARPLLQWPSGVDVGRVTAMVDAIWLGRDLINTPANDMGPAELEAAARSVAGQHGAPIATIVGDALIERGFRLLHAVGRASPRAPRLIDFTWGRADAPKVTLVGKGICFDTGGLDLKPSAAMLLMKKDMGGAASALALAHMIMSAGLDVRLRVLIAAAENAVAGEAFRPGDIIRSRAGKTVEIGNTDAEGRLVLADALSLADEEAPDTIVTFATLTGAARVALGADLPPLFSTDDALADEFLRAGRTVGDPMWRMPFWAGYERLIDSDAADMNNVSDGPFGGAITAALFLRRFVAKAGRYAHIDMYGWRPAARALGPKGGEAHTARALFAALSGRYPAKASS